MALSPRFERFQTQLFLVPVGLLWHPVWYILESNMFTKPIPEWENAPADQIVPTGRYWTIMRSSVQLRTFGMLPDGVYSVLKNTMEPRMSQTMVPVALRKSPYITFYDKSRNCNKWTFEDVPQARATAVFRGGMLQWNRKSCCGSVSYTHLTLPTICSV